MECAARPLDVGEALGQHGIGEEAAVVDGLVDARDALIDDAARAEIEMADFAVALLPRGKTDSLAARADRGVRKSGEHRAIVRHLRGCDGIAACLLRDAEAVEDAEDGLAALRRCGHRSRAIR